ncbi:MAG TPA: hypothetical protein V6D25_26055 [Leptolyngbyaceae cyanobacterium]
MFSTITLRVLLHQKQATPVTYGGKPTYRSGLTNYQLPITNYQPPIYDKYLSGYDITRP